MLRQPWKVKQNTDMTYFVMLTFTKENLGLLIDEYEKYNKYDVLYKKKV